MAKQQPSTRQPSKPTTSGAPINPSGPTNVQLPYGGYSPPSKPKPKGK
jgi:hypothetical protein